MKIKYIFTFLVSFLFINSYGQQDFEWTWAKRGGGIDGLSPSYNIGDTYYDDEKIVDIAVDQSNNYYFVAEVGKTETTFDDIAFDTYQNQNNNKGDAYIISTDCQGNFRWQKTIGGSKDDRIMDIATDEMGGIYAIGQTKNSLDDGTSVQVHFDTDSIKPFGTGTGANPMPDPAHKGIFLIKYDVDGNFQWLVEPESDALPSIADSGFPMGMVVEPNGTVHFMTVLGPGIHAGDNIEVPENELRIVILKYSANGDYLNHIIVPVEMFPISYYSVEFHYDRFADQYYFGAYKRGSSSPEIYTDEVLLQGSMLIAAFDNQGNQLWRHDNLKIYGAFIFDIETDDDSNIYFTGMANNYSSDGGLDGDTMAGYNFTQTHSSGGVGDNGAFLIKLDANGNLIWGTNADTTCRFSSRTIVVNGDEVAIGLGLSGSDWAGAVFDRPENHLNDPVVVRFNKETGATIAIEDIMGTSGQDDEVTALAVDNNGNYVVGGFIKSTLFSDHPTVPMILNSGGPSDFFVGQLAHTDCTETSSVEEADFSGLKIYPNPTSDMLYVEANFDWASYKMYSITGQLVAQGQLDQQEVSMMALEVGIYFLELQDLEGRKEVVKVVKE